MREQLRTKALLSLENTIAKDFFENYEYPWKALPDIGSFILQLGATLSEDEYDKVGEDVWIAKDAKVAPTASISGPTIIDHEAEIRHCAFIRGKAIIGKKATLGNSCEVKNSILFDCAQVPHFNYVGDSVLGFRAHMGAGSITSNIKSDKTLVTILTDDRKIETGLRKFGAILGDYVEVGCNSVLNPGAVVGRNVTIYPLSSVRGFVPENSVFKNQNNIVRKWDD